jgi:Threonine/Serine exporter, ThrE
VGRAEAEGVGGQGAEEATELLLRFARAGHDAGYPTADLEERILALAPPLGLIGTQISATPTVVEISVGSLPHQRSYTLRVAPLSSTSTRSPVSTRSFRISSRGVLTPRVRWPRSRGRAAPFGDDAAAFVAASMVGVVGGVVGYALRRSALVFVVPGVLMLVPGSAGFNSVVQLLSNQTVSGISAGFDTFVTAMSIAYGLMVSSLVLPRRFTSVAPARGKPTAMGESHP